jgi:hypothetical protein
MISANGIRPLLTAPLSVPTIFVGTTCHYTTTPVLPQGELRKKPRRSVVQLDKIEIE